MPTALEIEIKAALIRFSEAIKRSDGTGVTASLSEVEHLLQTGRDELHPQLVHFLEGRSYAKALGWLGAAGTFGVSNPSAPPGGCGGRR